MKTGYFYYYPAPGQFGRASENTHVVDGEEKPLCGVARHKDSRFAFCAAGIHKPYLSCKRCIEKIKTLEATSASND